MILFETRLEGVLDLAAQGCGAMPMAAFALGALRVALGPTAADRVVALDFVAMTLAAFLMLLGGGFTLVAGIGLVRLGDVFMRMRASTKAGTLGVGLVGLALALISEESGVASRAIGCVAFLLMTGPVGAPLIGRAAARVGAQDDRDAAEATPRALSPEAP